MRVVESNTNPTLSLVKQSRTELYPALKLILDEARKGCHQEMKINGSYPYGKELRTIIDVASSRLGFTLAQPEIEQLVNHLETDRNGFGILQPLIDDPSVTDIIITSYKKIMIQKGCISSATALNFSSQEEYENFVERILFKAGSSYSTKLPIADGMIGSLIRINAIHKGIATNGPYLTIRINRFSVVTTDDLTHSQMASCDVMKTLEDYVVAGKTILIVGEVGTGKTTLARAISASIPSFQSILVIEDTPEIKLDHPNVRYIQTRSENCEGEGKISPRQCIKAGMRMSMNRIIYGEIRDPEAAEGFIDCCSSGHSGVSTIHARSISDCIIRLMLFIGRVQTGVSREMLLEQIAMAIQIVVQVGVCPETKLRRIIKIREIRGVSDGVVKYTDLYEYKFNGILPMWKKLSPRSHYLDRNL